MGENYDARLERARLAARATTAREWTPVRAAEPASPPLLAPQVRRIQEVRPVKILKSPRADGPGPGPEHGRLRPHEGARRRHTVTLRHAEVLDKAGELYTDNLRVAKQTVRYMLKGGAEESVRAALHLSRVPLRARSRAAGEPTLDSITGLCTDWSGPAASRARAPEPAAAQHRVGPEGQFPRCAHGLPAARRAAGLDRDAQVFARTTAFNMDVAGSSPSGWATSRSTRPMAACRT